MWFASKKENRRILFVLGLKDSDIGITRIDLFYQICFTGFSAVYMPFSFQHATGSWTADLQGSFPSFPAFCSPTLHDKGIDLSDFYGHTRVYSMLISDLGTHKWNCCWLLAVGSSIFMVLELYRNQSPCRPAGRWVRLAGSCLQGERKARSACTSTVLLRVRVLEYKGWWLGLLLPAQRSQVSQVSVVMLLSGLGIASGPCTQMIAGITISTEVQPTVLLNLI